MVNPIFHLPRAGDVASAELLEISGAPSSVRTTLRVSRPGHGSLEVTVDAADPDPLALVASAPTGRADEYLYEEDCLQVVTARPGDARPSGLCLVNPLGNRKDVGAAGAWEIAATRHGAGWRVAIRMTLPPGVATLGLGVLRYFRGVHHEVHGIGHPHPVDVSELAVVVLEPAADPRAVAERHVTLARTARAAELECQLSACRARLSRSKHSNGPRASIETARELAFARAELPVPSKLESLCWNESHFQHALIDLWELDGERHWFDLAVDRMDRTWEMRSDRRGLVDKHWGAVLPTWYDTGIDFAMTLVSGVILAPIARLIRLVHETPALAELRPRVEPWVAMAREVIGVHDREWVELPDGFGNYLEPYEKGPSRVYPVGGSRLCPLNRAFLLALPMIDLAAVAGDEAYLDKARRMALYFRGACETTAEGGLVWEYLRSRYPADGEDLSHAACQVLFAERCAADGIVITESELHGIARTLEAHVFRHGDVPCETIRGHEPALNLAVASWASLCRFVPNVLPKIVDVVETLLAEGGFDFRREGFGVVSLTRLEKAGRALGRRG
jgi:hypothetical protein